MHNTSAFDCGSCNCVDGVSALPKWKIDNFPNEEGYLQTNKCLAKLVTPLSSYFISLYQHYENGFLATHGGIVDQPNIYLAAMRIIDTRTKMIALEKQNARK